MKFKYITLALIASATLGSCKEETKKVEEVVETVEVEAPAAPVVKEVTFKLDSKSGSNAAGTAIFKEKDGQVTFTAVLGGLTEGTHAIHIHQTADCSSEDGTSAGGHWNPTNEPHGKWGATEGFHKGDIGNFPVDESGNGTITKTTDKWCIGCGDPKKDVLGKGIIVHQGTDDFTSQPSGAAGKRVSCGGIIQ